MQEINNNKLDTFEDEINLKELFNILLNAKWVIISFTLFVSTIGVIYSLLLPNIYESRAILVPVDQSSSISSGLGGYSSLAGLAGLSLPQSGDKANSVKAIQKITTLSFFENNILANIFLPDLLAIKSWDFQSNQLMYDEKIYDINKNSWIKDYSYLKTETPSAQESFAVFNGKHFSLSEDKKTGFITLSMKHQSPVLAKQWLELVVNEVNGYYRDKDKSESEKAAIYLNQQISTTNLSEIKQVLAQLLKEEIKKLALIEANQFYVFEYIDPPAVMEKKSEPKRAFICIISALLGGMLSILFVLIRHYVFNEKAS